MRRDSTRAANMARAGRPLWGIASQNTSGKLAVAAAKSDPPMLRRFSALRDSESERRAAVSADEHRKTAAKKRGQQAYPSPAETLCGPPPADSVP